VSIDLGGINGVEFLAYEGEKHGMGSVRVGSGARWGDVYKVLEGINESVVGGRSADVGVGGFILGGKLARLHFLAGKTDELVIIGGISFLSRQHGWAIDNVKNFEVCLILLSYSYFSIWMTYGASRLY
jgi:hypothetical protein